MFCEKCGTELPDTAEFCINCGTKIKRGEIRTVDKKIPDTEIQLKVKPSFKLGYMILPVILPLGIVVLVYTFMISIISLEAGLKTFIKCSILLSIIVAIKILFNKKQYDNFSYDFYKTKVIYADSFLNVSEKEVKYKYIREVTMSQTFIQRYFNIGNIILFTNAESGYNNGIYIRNIENVQDVYRNIKSIIDV